MLKVWPRTSCEGQIRSVPGARMLMPRETGGETPSYEPFNASRIFLWTHLHHQGVKMMVKSSG